MNSHPEAKQAGTDKKTYKTPELRTYGSLAALTATSTTAGSVSDMTQAKTH